MMWFIAWLTLWTVVSLPATFDAADNPADDPAPDSGGWTLYAAPAFGAAVIADIAADAPVTVNGRADVGYWLDVSAGGRDGWAYLNDLPAPDAFALDALPVTGQQITMLDTAAFPLDDADDDLLAALDGLARTPVLHNFDSPRLAQIIAEGDERGNRRGLFIKIGDSNSTTGDYLRPMGMRHGGCQYGAFDYLRETVAYFSAESPYPEFRNSFDSTNITAQNGLNTFGLFDPFWADSEACRGGESPLECEYRLLQPSVAVTMIGLMDLEQIPVETYRRNLDRAVAWLVDHGVIPVLMTFPVLPDYPEAGARSLWPKSIMLNAAIIDIAEDHQVPLINLWAAFQPLPDYGIGPDRTHIRHQVGAFCDFTGAEARVGGTLRNLLILQGLDRLRVDWLAIP